MNTTQTTFVTKATSRQDATPRIAIIGCGAFAEKFYLPAVAAHRSLALRAVLVDSSLGRVQALSRQFGVSQFATDYQEIADAVDGVVVAAPHHLHYRITLDFLRRGVHVLCEKPLTASPREAREMVDEADRRGVTLSANYTQRLFPASQKIREILATRALGLPLSIKYWWGDEFRWPTASGFYFNTRSAPRGVLLDRGPHAVDLIGWWLGGKMNLLSSENDSFGGPEAKARVRFERDGCQAEINLSWLSRLPNRYVIETEQAVIDNGYEDWWQVPISFRSGKTERVRLDAEEKEYFEYGRQVLRNFVETILHGTSPLVPAREVIPSVDSIEECYARAERFSMPWNETFEVSRV